MLCVVDIMTTNKNLIYIAIFILCVEVSSLVYIQNSELALSYLKKDFNTIQWIIMIILKIPLYIVFGLFVFVFMLSINTGAVISSFPDFWQGGLYSVIIGYTVSIVSMFCYKAFYKLSFKRILPNLSALLFTITIIPLLINCFFMSMGV